jgi:hypothetical protein
MHTTSNDTGRLCFLSAADVRSPAGYMGGLELRGVDNERLGRLAGLLIDADHRRLRYLVVDAPSRPGRCCLVGTDEIVCLDPGYRTLRIAAPEATPRIEFDLDLLRFFPDRAT